MSDETTRVDQWLRSVLVGDATLAGLALGGVHADYAPRGTRSPWVVFSYQGGADTLGHAANRVMHVGVWRVVAVAEAHSFTAVQALADRFDVLLDGKPNAGSSTVASVDGATILSSTRQLPVRLAEEIDGTHYRTLGALYRVAVQR